MGTQDSAPSARLPAAEFARVIAATPLVSIDLIVRNSQQQVLLGKRLNRPAQGFWFVPGGRIRKNETLRAAFLRLCETELGMAPHFEAAQWLGHYEHFYHDNALDAPHISTHYVVLAYALELAETVQPSLADQHAEQCWWSIPDLLASDAVHAHTKDYFNR